MSEFKFACPVCGQHITADSSTSGTQLNCPTCFRTIVVPQAPADSASKLILSAAQPSKDRPISAGASGLDPLRRRRPGISIAGAVLLVLLAVAVAVVFTFRAEFGQMLKRATGPLAKQSPGQPAPPVAPVSSDRVKWNLDLNRARIPDRPASGKIHGRPFICEQAIVSGGGLFLRQGQGWPPDLSMALVVPREQAEQYVGTTVEFTPGQSAPLPQVILRWKDEQNREQKVEFSSGYALRLTLEQPVGGRIAGKLFLATPDENKSVVAGTFDAEIKSRRK